MHIKFATIEAESYYNNAKAFEAQEEWKKAADNFELAAEADPMHPEVWYRLGNARARAQYPGWENQYNHDYFSAMDCDATTPDELYWQAKAGEAIAGWFNDETDEEAAAEYAARVALDPNNAEAWFAYGQSFSSSDERMMHCFNQALALDSDNRSYYFERAKLYRKKGCFEEALADYEKALHNELMMAVYYLSRGSFFVEHDHLAEAMGDYNTSLAIAHTTSCAKERGRLCLLAHDFEGALNGYGLTKHSYYDWREDGVNIKYPAPGNAAAAVRWEEAVQALERSGLIEATHPDYLKGLCEHYLDRYHKFYSKPGSEEALLAQYFSKPGPEEALSALAAADALVTAKPRQPSFRELRIACQLTQPTPDMAALALDYEWLSQQPSLLSKTEKESNREVRIFSAASRKRVANLHKRVEYLHKLAWAQHDAGNHAGALASFAMAVGSPLQEHYKKDLDYCADEDNFTTFLPPVPAEDYVLWQLRQQLTQCPTSMSTHRQIRSWLSVAIKSLPGEVGRELLPAFDRYQLTYLMAGTYFVQPRTAEQYTEALASCAAGALKVPELADIFKQMSLNILKGQLREATNRDGATEASKAAALAHYDAARAEMLTQWRQPV